MSAPAGAIVGGSIEASQGEHVAHVALDVIGASTVPGAGVAYRVRGVLQGGATYTDVSAATSGHRGVGPLGFTWQRSAGSTATDFETIPGSAASVLDTTAPQDGSRRWYQVVSTAEGATPITVGPVEGWRLAFASVATGELHTCALTNDGQAWCWGANGDGQLGSGDTQPHDGPVRVAVPAGVSFGAIALGARHACAVANGDVWCWGRNATGEVGDGTASLRSSPVALGLSGVARVSAGRAHVSAAPAQGAATTRTWGENTDGQLGDGTSEDRWAPVAVLSSGGTAISDITFVASGGAHTCARRLLNVLCWGAGDSGQLGNGGVSGSHVPVSIPNLAVAELVAGAAHTCARMSNGTVRCWGGNGAGQLGDGSTMMKSAPSTAVAPLGQASQIAASSSGTCARVGASGVWCWGADTRGQLGNGGTNTDAPTPVQVQGLIAPSAVGAGPASEHVCAIVDFVVKCWGRNDAGQLGDGTSADRGSPVTVSFP